MSTGTNQNQIRHGVDAPDDRFSSGVMARHKRMKVAAGVALACVAMGSQAQNCVPNPADLSYLPGNTDPSCTVIPATSGQLVQPATAGFYLLTRSNLKQPLIVGNTDVKAYVTGGYGGIGNQYAYYDPNATPPSLPSMQAGNIAFDIVSTGNTASIGSHSGVNITAGDVNIKATLNAPLGSQRLMYGVLAGSTVDSGESSTTRNGTYTSVTLNNLTLNQIASGLITPLNSGLRAIQGASQNSGNGSSGKIEIANKLDMTLTGSRIEGIYVSGASTANGTEAVSQVRLKDSTITMIRGASALDSSAIKIGKSRDVGTGKGLVTSSGNLTINMGATFGGTAAYMSPAIKMAVSGSQLLANEAGSSADITASRSALAIGIDDWGTSTDSGVAPNAGIQALFGKAMVKTLSTTHPLLLVDSGQQNARMLFDNGSDLTAASNGYLIDIIKYRASTTSSSVQLDLDHGSVAKGLSNRSFADSTVNIGLSNGSTWTLVEKTDGGKTSTYDHFSMASNSRLNGFKAGAAAFVMNGPVSSDASTIQLADGTPGDVMTIQTNYLGGNGAILAVDTCLGASGAPSDKLIVTGNADGSTEIQVTPFADAATCNGADTSSTGDGNGILVVEVQDTSHAVFTLAGGTVTQGSYSYRLVKVGNNWYLQSQANPGSVTVGKQVNAPAGAPAFSGSIPFTLSCANPDFSQSGTITVNNNQGTATPISVASGSTCSVSEGTLPTPPTGYSWGPVSLPEQGLPMPAGGSQTFTITNTLRQDAPLTGSLVVTKTVQVPEGATPYTGSINFSVACTNPVFNTTGSIAVTNNQGSAQPITLPVGSQCTVNETLPTAPDGMEWAAPNYIQSGSITAGQTATSSITNTLTRKAVGSVTPVPVNTPLALGGLAALIGLSAFLRQRRERRRES